jgi:hypothetical protein
MLPSHIDWAASVTRLEISEKDWCVSKEVVERERRKRATHDTLCLVDLEGKAVKGSRSGAIIDEGVGVTVGQHDIPVINGENITAAVEPTSVCMIKRRVNILPGLFRQ